MLYSSKPFGLCDWIKLVSMKKNFYIDLCNSLVENQCKVTIVSVD